MTVAPERPVSAPRKSFDNLIEVAETVYRTFPGCGVEILGGQLTVNPPPDGGHARSLTRLTVALDGALDEREAQVGQSIGLWLPAGEDYTVPDLAVVDADFEEHVVAFNCYAPHVFRMVLEITSTNHLNDTVAKPAAYASAGVPVYVVGDRTAREVVVLSDPRSGEYRSRSVYRPGESFVLPESIGAKVELEADTLLDRAPRQPEA